MVLLRQTVAIEAPRLDANVLHHLKCVAATTHNKLISTRMVVTAHIDAEHGSFNRIRHQMHGSLDIHESTPKRHIDWFNRFCRAHSREPTYTYLHTWKHRQTTDRPRYVVHL